ncbi:MAG: methyltransferase domain-containing protein [Chloroflexi bacterium]|nr:methyltransferase domain-containing protein [Chloroflexota bacterium]
MERLTHRPRYGHFNWLAPFYDRIFGAIGNEALFERLQVRSGDTVLDIGGGTGRVAHQLSTLEARVIVIDPSPKMLAHADAKGLPAVRSLAEQLPFASNSIERIFVVDAFHHFANQTLAAQEMVRVLTQNGRIVIEEMDLRHLVVKGVALAEKLALMQSHFYTPTDLAQLFVDAGATIVEIAPHNISAHLVFTK